MICRCAITRCMDTGQRVGSPRLWLTRIGGLGMGIKIHLAPFSTPNLRFLSRGDFVSGGNPLLRFRIKKQKISEKLWRKGTIRGSFWGFGRWDEFEKKRKYDLEWGGIERTGLSRKHLKCAMIGFFWGGFVQFWFTVPPPHPLPPSELKKKKKNQNAHSQYT